MDDSSSNSNSKSENQDSEARGASEAASEAARKRGRPKLRPNIFSYHDYVPFLRDWFDYRRKTERGFSVRSFSIECNLSHGLMALIAAGKRPLTETVIEKISPYLGLSLTELSYLDWLRKLSEAPDEISRHRALEKIQMYRGYQKANPKEREAYRYMAHWYYAAIRELAGLKRFKDDPQWILEELKGDLSEKEVEDALEFMLEHGFLVREAGKIKRPEKQISCGEGIWRIALSRFHREMLQLMIQAIDDATPREMKAITGYTLTLPKERFSELRAIIDEARGKIAKLERDFKNPDQVYQVGFYAIPLTRPEKG